MLGNKVPLRKESATYEDERDGGNVRVSPELSKSADEGGVAPPPGVPVASSRSRLRAAVRKVMMASGVVTQLTAKSAVVSQHMEKSRSFSRKAFDAIASLSEEVGGGTL